MHPRQALNVTYAWMVSGMTREDRQRFDNDLHGWTELNLRAERALRGGIDDMGGGEG